MNWDGIVDERARSRRKRIRLLSVMLVGDFVGALVFVLAYAGFLDWLVAAPFTVVGWGTGAYMMWRIIIGQGPATEKTPKEDWADRGKGFP